MEKPEDEGWRRFLQVEHDVTLLGCSPLANLSMVGDVSS